MFIALSCLTCWRGATYKGHQVQRNDKACLTKARVNQTGLQSGYSELTCLY